MGLRGRRYYLLAVEGRLTLARRAIAGKQALVREGQLTKVGNLALLREGQLTLGRSATRRC